MLGAIAGDIIGSVHERAATKQVNFRPLFHQLARFTDDTVLTLAVADHLLHGGDLVDTLKEYARHYPRAGYGGTFIRWANHEDRAPYNSWGNGSAMRVSPVGFAFDTLEEVLEHAKRTAEVTHNHPEGIKGAQAVAASIFLARTGESKAAIRAFVETSFGYDLGTPLDAIRYRYSFEVSCQGSVPQSIRAFLEADDYEHAVRLAISLGGDADTMACIAGSIAHPFFGGVPLPIREAALERLDDRLRSVVEAFEAKYPC
jgi:ADP-ribosylglycohydrolase